MGLLASHAQTWNYDLLLSEFQAVRWEDKGLFNIKKLRGRAQFYIGNRWEFSNEKLDEYTRFGSFLISSLTPIWRGLVVSKMPNILDSWLDQNKTALLTHQRLARWLHSDISPKLHTNFKIYKEFTPGTPFWSGVTWWPIRKEGYKGSI